ncbi:MAG: hypothetical protein KIT36_03340 [Alphaproteobacteria bacterium]|nr:hypothetical protein [Alphaproteobacteria bacterium]
MPLSARLTAPRPDRARPAVVLMAPRRARTGRCCDVCASPLDILRRRLRDATPSAALACGDERLQAPLFAMALKHIEALAEQGFTTLPWRVGLFGRAHVTCRKQAYLHPGHDGRVKFLDLDSGRRDAPMPPQMHYGASIDPDADITTEDQGALLVYASGTCLYVPPRHSGAVHALGQSWARPHRLDAAG